MQKKRSTVSSNEFEILKEQLKHKFSLEMVVVTGSMAPVIPVGSKISVEPLLQVPEKFDIIVFWNGEILISHYVRHLNYLTSNNGDQTVVTQALSGGEDLPVSFPRILGRVTSHSLSSWVRFKIVVLKPLFRR